jgi:hypothetical protein
VSLNLGGGDAPLVDLGNGNNAGSTVSVDTGTDAGLGVDLNLNGNGSGGGGLLGGNLIDTDGDGPLLDLSPDDGGAVVNLGGSGSGGGTGGTGGLLGLGTGGNVLDLGDGPLLDLNGDDDVDAVVDLDLASTDGTILDLDGLLGIDSETGTLLDLGDGALLDLTEDNTELAALDLFDTPVTAIASLDGDEDSVLDIDIGASEEGIAGTGLLPGVSGAVDVLDGDTVLSVDLAQSGTGGGDDDDGTGGGDDDDGTGGGDDDDGNGGGDDGNTPGIDVSATGSIGSGRAIGNDACVTLDNDRLAALQSRTYDWATIKGWAAAKSLRVVEIEVCAEVLDTALVALNDTAGITRLQAFFDTQAKVKAGLRQMGHDTGDIIAADIQGETLVVYVVGD